MSARGDETGQPSAGRWNKGVRKARPGARRQGDAGYDLEPDVERIHRPIYREPRDPVEGREPAPWWVWAAAVLVLFWGGWYLGRYGGTFGQATHLAYAPRAGAVARESAGRAALDRDPITAGQQIYTAHCQACHQESGAGVPGVFPPIAGSEWVTGPPETVVRIVLHGLHRPIQVAGQTYDGVMPGWRHQFSDEDVAGVATYIRQWGVNTAGAVDPEVVKALRASATARTAPWTADELRAAEGG